MFLDAMSHALGVFEKLFAPANDGLGFRSGLLNFLMSLHSLSLHGTLHRFWLLCFFTWHIVEQTRCQSRSATHVYSEDGQPF
jgi:hypothetical protein